MCLHILVSPTRSYKSTQTQHAACLNAGMNRYPNFYRISRFDIWINKKFDISISKENTAKQRHFSISCLIWFHYTICHNIRTLYLTRMREVSATHTYDGLFNSLIQTIGAH